MSIAFPVASATAAQLELTPGKTLEVRFSVSDSLSATPDTLLLNFGTEIDVQEAFVARTATLYNGGVPIGTDTAFSFGDHVGLLSLNPSNSWKSAASLHGGGKIVDFGGLFTGSQDAKIAFSISSGRILFDPASIYIDHIVATGQNTGGVVEPFPQIISVAVVPEPTTASLGIFALAIMAVTLGFSTARNLICRCRIQGLGSAIALLLVCLSSQPAFGVIDAGTSTVDTIGHQVDPFIQTGGLVVRDFFVNQSQEVGGALLPSVTLDLDLDTAFSYTLSAPTGYKFLIDVPQGDLVLLDIDMGWATANAASDLGGTVVLDVAFTDLVGVAPFIINFNSRVGDDSQFLFVSGDSTAIGADLSFTSVTFTIHYGARSLGYGPLTYEPTLGLPISGQSQVGPNFYAYYFTPDQVDPGPFVSIVAIPEPSSLILGLMGIAAFLLLGRGTVAWS